jgi:hypothetical protein
MLSFDGAGYGKSVTWDYRIKSIAKENGEICPCWENNIPYYLIEGTNFDEVKFKIYCQKKTEVCCKSFPETEKSVTEIFKRQYK